MIDCLFLDSDDQRHFPADDRRVIHSICTDAEPKIRSALPLLPAMIEFAAQTGSRVIPEVGSLGMAVSLDRIIWVVDPHHSGGIAAVAQKHLFAMLAHECHHLTRGWVFEENPQRPYSMLEAVVSEGLATAFQRDITGVTPLWGAYPEQASIWVQELLSLQADATYQHWMFQHPDGRKWIGYKAGTYLADKAFQSTGLTAAELVSIPAQEILRMAGLEG